MTLFTCECCNFSSPLKANLKRHLNTKKHLLNEEKSREEAKKKNNFPPNSLQNPPKKNNIPPKSSEIPPKSEKFPPKSLQNPPNLSEKLNNSENYSVEPKKSSLIKNTKFYICDNCNREFSRKDNLKRHMETRCKVAEQKVDYKEMFFLMKDELQKEKEDFKKQISILLEKVGNTTTNITNTQNIQLNSYGNEDLSHITDSLKNELIKIPFGMIPKMIEEVHFSSKKPENKNIVLTNKKDNKIMVFTNNKWVYRNKDETINDLVDGKYYILDTHYQKMEKEQNYKFTESNKTTYDKFKTYFDEGDKKIVEQLKKDCELILLNNR